METQYQYLNDNSLALSGPTAKTLPPGMYEPMTSMSGLYFRVKPIVTDDLVLLEDSPAVQVTENIRKFWTKAQHYKRHGMLHKRGVFIYGPPGSGKTAAIIKIAQELVEDGGVVFSITNPDIGTAALMEIRKLEATRPITCIYEEFDELVEDYENEILHLLDGVNQVNHVVHLATTNYIDKIPDRIKNRPSRFDEVIEIGMPCINTRLSYILTKFGDSGITPSIANKWAKDTEGMSLAHIKELFIAVSVLELDYKKTIKRLRAMMKDSTTLVED